MPTPTPDEMWLQIQGLLGRVAALQSAFRSPATDISIYSGSPGALAYHNSGDSAEGPYWYDGSGWRRAWNMPWGIPSSGSTSSTSNQTSISTQADITFATLTFTAITGRLYRVTLTARFAQITSTGTQSLSLQTGASGAGTEFATTNTPSVAANGSGVGTIVGFITGNGSTSVHARAATSAGTITVQNATTTGWFVVEDIGPTGGPP